MSQSPGCYNTLRQTEEGSALLNLPVSSWEKIGIRKAQSSQGLAVTNHQQGDHLITIVIMNAWNLLEDLYPCTNLGQLEFSRQPRVA